ncbi:MULTISPECIES: radical SAM protein [Clostridium]|uniref:radical SAM protein n=1 Tax=Clostridium TaxID=1485 RepID=UPI00069DBD61|nr:MULTISPECIES: radical SAM protein [Clostridium]KOF56533.1 radical SAM protein [Clostridium sp. DMHC 10]MCD2348865.1 radical SAM protein [Clostridium guangxiense]
MKLTESLEKGMKESLIKVIISYIDKNPEKNVNKIFGIVKSAIKDPYSLSQIDTVLNYYNTNKSVHEYIQNILKTVNKKCLKKFFVNFLSNGVWYGMSKRDKYLNDENIKIPFVILLSPSMRCNLKCTGCYAGNYSKKDDIPFKEVDRIIEEARNLGTYFFIILGGEPFINNYMLDIYQKYNDCMFVPFTNGTLFTENLADKIQKLGNVAPMFSLEGFEKETDARRGKGTFNKVMHGMDLLRKRGIVFGVSSATSTHNFETVSSKKFIQMLIDKGSKISWYFIYMPVGVGVDVKNMLTPTQRIELGRRTREIRTTMPYFCIDFFNDAPYVGGCIAGKYYCHINAKEDVEPCIFSHFSSFNVKNQPLLDAFKTPYFKELRKRQPYNKNLLMPCMMIDNPTVVREVVKKTNAKPTDESANNMISNPEFMKELDELAANFKPAAEKAWKKDFNCAGNYKMSKG